MSPYEREEEILGAQYASGQLTLAEYNKSMRDLQREEQADVYERAEQAFQNELNNW